MNLNVIVVFCSPGVYDAGVFFVAIKQVQMMELELVSHGFYLGLEFKMVSFLKLIESLLIILVSFLRYGENDISKII